MVEQAAVNRKVGGSNPPPGAKGKIMKIFTREIYNCISCPNVTSDQNITRFLCRCTNTFICWMGKDEDDAPIPKNCPLPDPVEIVHYPN